MWRIYATYSAFKVHSISFVLFIHIGTGSNHFIATKHSTLKKYKLKVFFFFFNDDFYIYFVRELKMPVTLDKALNLLTCMCKCVWFDVEGEVHPFMTITMQLYLDSAWDLRLWEGDRSCTFKRDDKSQVSHKEINLPCPKRKLIRCIWVSMLLLDRKCRLKIHREVVYYRIQHM